MKSLFLFFLICYSLGASAQPGDLLGDLFEGVVRQPDEFTELFNSYTENPDSVDWFRKLINGPKLLESGVSEDALYDWLERIKAQAGNEKLIDSQWVVELNSDVLFQKEQYPTTFYLQLMKDADFEYESWRIVGARSSFIQPDSIIALSLSPVSQNIDFLPLSKNLKYGENNLTGMIKSDYEFDDLSVLAVLFNSNLAKLSQVKDYSMFYPDFLGYSFRIERLDNGGEFPSWAITELNSSTK